MLRSAARAAQRATAATSRVRPLAGRVIVVLPLKAATLAPCQSLIITQTKIWRLKARAVSPGREGGKARRTAVFRREFGDVVGPLDSCRVVSSGRCVAELHHRLPRRRDAVGLVPRLQQFDGAAIGVELHLLQLRRDIEEGLWTQMAEPLTIELNVTESVVAAFMRHEESAVKRRV